MLLTTYPSFGISYSNLGGKYDYNQNLIFPREGETFEVEIPNILRFGLSNRIAFSKVQKNYKHDFISLLAALEYSDNEADQESVIHYGAEFGLFEMLYIRAGKNDYENYIETDYRNKGISFTCRGLKKLIGADNYNPESIINRINLAFNYSRMIYEVKYDYFEYKAESDIHKDFYELIISLDL